MMMTQMRIKEGIRKYGDKATRHYLSNLTTATKKTSKYNRGKEPFSTR